MATSGRVVEITFTPAAAGKLIVTAYFRCEGSGSDWGSGHSARAFCEQSSTTTYDGSTPTGNTMGSYTIIGAFDVTGGSEVKCGLYGVVSGAAAMTFYDAFVRAELIKR